MSAPVSGPDPAVAAAAGSSHEARLLADLLRTSRVTLLFGASDDGRSDLLRRSVLPLLQRRTGDRRRRSAPGPRPAGAPAERRGPRGAGRRKLTERILLFDDWDGAPLAGLQVAILSSLPMDAVLNAQSERLAALLQEICDRVSGRFLIVLDGFDRLFSGASSAESIQEFVEQFSEAVNLHGLRVNFLLSVDERSEPLLEPLRQRIPGFDDATLRLRRREVAQDSPAVRRASPMADATRTVPLEVMVPAPAAPAAPLAPAAPVSSVPVPPRARRRRLKRTPTPPQPPIGVGGVYAFIETTLTQTTGTVQPWGEGDTTGELLSPVVSAGGRLAVPTRPGQAGSGPSADRTDDGRHGRVGPAQVVHAPAPPNEPPSPIDQWLDAATAWWRRLFGAR